MDRRLSKDIGLQVLSVVLAVVLWIQATAVQNPIDRFTFDGVPVVYGGVPQGLVVADVLHPTKVNVTVKCRRRIGEKLNAASFQAKVSLEAGRTGSADYPVEITGPAGVEIIEISPAAVQVTMERAASAQVPVEARAIGTVPDGYSAGMPVPTPTQVTVSGPASEVGRVVKAVAEVDLTGAQADLASRARLVATDANGSPVAGVSFSPAEVSVVVPVVALPAAESVDVDAALSGTPAAGYAVLRITTDPARVQVRPEPGKSVDFTHILTEPVDISGVTSDLTTTARLVVPDGIASVTPAAVEVVVEIGASREFTDLPVSVRNVGTGLQGSVSPATVDLVLRGPRAILDRLVAGDISVWVDAAGKPAGQSDVAVNVTFPDWAAGEIEVTSADPANVTLTLGH